jgi:hypothetical protein
MQATTPSANHWSEVDTAVAVRFLQLLGKEPADAWLRFFAHKLNQDRDAIGAKMLRGFSAKQIMQQHREQRGAYVVIGNGGNKDAEITCIPALFVEWDDIPVEQQVIAWQRLGLPEPSLMVSTGGASVHCYWLLQEPVTPALWKPEQKRLIAYCKSDPKCSNTSRVMRLPGTNYIGADGSPTARVEFIHESENRYTIEQVMALVPVQEPQRPAPAPAQPFPGACSGDLPPRPEAAILDAFSRIPPFDHGQGRRDELLGLALRLWQEVGKERAYELLAEHSPTVRDLAGYFSTEPTQISPGSLWPFLRDHYGIDIRRHDLKRPPRADGVDGFQVVDGEQQQAQQGRFVPRPDTQARWGKKRLSHERAMACFDRCIDIQAQRQRNSLRRRARLLKAAADLELAKFINRQEIAQKVLEAKDRAAGRCFQVLTADDRAAMERPHVQWLIPGLMPAGDLSIIGGRPKVGKTRFAFALAFAVLTGTSLLDLPAPMPSEVVLITDDQSDGDTADMLEALKLWNHPRLSWSRNFRLTESDLDSLLVAIRQRPGALVIIDSLRSISRSLQCGENDPELGSLLYDLKDEVIGVGGTLLLIHHCNKAEGLVGIEALSGHSSIAGAANGVITLHHLPDEKGRPQKELTQRRLVMEARSSQAMDVVISPMAGTGTFYKVGNFSEWAKEQKQESDEQAAIGKMSHDRKEILRVLTSDRERWFTRREICEAIGVAWEKGGRGADAQRVKRSLAWMVQTSFAETVRAGQEATWRASQGAQLRDSSTPSTPSSDTSRSEGDTRLTPSTPSRGGGDDLPSKESKESFDRFIENAGHDRKESKAPALTQPRPDPVPASPPADLARRIEASIKANPFWTAERRAAALGLPVEMVQEWIDQEFDEFDEFGEVVLVEVPPPATAAVVPPSSCPGSASQSLDPSAMDKPLWVRGERGWSLPGGVSLSGGASQNIVVRDPMGVTRLVSRGDCSLTPTAGPQKQAAA